MSKILVLMQASEMPDAHSEGLLNFTLHCPHVCLRSISEYFEARASDVHVIRLLVISPGMPISESHIAKVKACEI